MRKAVVSYHNLLICFVVSLSLFISYIVMFEPLSCGMVPMTPKENFANNAHLRFTGKWSGEPVVHSKFSVLINTFRGRDDFALEALKRYSQCDLVDRVVLLWNDYTRTVPSDIQAFCDSDSKAYVAVQNSTELSNRFKPQAYVRTDAIFSTDEDLVYGCQVLEFAFKKWLQDPEALVGFDPRLIEEKNHTFGYYWGTSWNTGLYNTLWVTKGAFLHRKFHDAFFSDARLSTVVQLVDKYITGEDITMSFVHAINSVVPKVMAVAIPDLQYYFQAQDTVAILGKTTAQFRKQIFQEIHSVLEKEALLDIMNKSATDKWIVAFDELNQPPRYFQDLTFKVKSVDN